MKKKLLSLMIISMFAVGTQPIFAEKNVASVDPNIYEKKEININNNFRENLRQREQLSDEQKALTFEKQDKTDNNLIKDHLFQSVVIETNTITSKSDQLGLFSQGEKQIKHDKEEGETSSNGSSVLLIMMAFAVIVIAAMFFLIIPRLKHTHN